MLVTSVSFFNEVATEMQKLSSETSVSFFNEVVSFFNEVAAEMQNYPRKSRFNP
jgi:hypothetical protein